MQEYAEELEKEMFGYADPGLLKVRGDEKKWVLS
jgi:hypothetical protein